MKNIVTLFLIIFLSSFAIAKEEFKNVGIAKYAVVEVINNGSPLRAEPNEDAKRITHLPTGTVLYALKESENYFLVELNNDKKYYINKKNVELQAIIPEKRLDDVKKISFNTTNNLFATKIETNALFPYTIEEKEKEIDFTFYDINFDPDIIKNESDVFSITTKKIDNEFSLNYKYRRPIFGYDVIKDIKGYNVVVKRPPLVEQKRPLKKIRVVLDAGHGGKEKGACAFNLEEKNINLQITKMLKRELKKRGAKVYLTRKKDKTVGLYTRVNFAKEKRGDILLSIHQNSLADRSKVNEKHGVGTYYFYDQAKPLAQAIQANLVKNTGFRDDGVNHASFALTRVTMPVSILIECGYIIHPEEAKLISNKKFQKTITKSIVNGMEEYLRDNF